MKTSAFRPRRVGILGGMGPAAAIDLQEKILAATPATTDAEHLPIVVWNVPQVPDRVAAVRGDGPSPVAAMVEGARALETAGCEAFAVACNTAHHWAGELAASVRIPMLHIADAAVDALSRRPVPPMRVGILATRGTLAAAFYGERLAQRGFAWIVPAEEEQARFVDEAIARVKAGDVAGARAPFEAAARALAGRGADLILLACTELPLAAEGADSPVPLLDASRALARAVVDFSLRR
ncbi:MAG TPA: amino acid racemase [Usitatibacteraceae bacterium]|nr:amino acid racemase [Usitatibacteraceae bacterium]